MNGDIMKLLDAEDVDIFTAYKEMGVELKEEDIQTNITVQFPNAIVSTNGVKGLQIQMQQHLAFL